jgi:hypothetical protein
MIRTHKKCPGVGLFSTGDSTARAANPACLRVGLYLSICCLPYPDKLRAVRHSVSCRWIRKRKWCRRVRDWGFERLLAKKLRRDASFRTVYNSSVIRLCVYVLFTCYYYCRVDLEMIVRCWVAFNVGNHAETIAYFPHRQSLYIFYALDAILMTLISANDEQPILACSEQFSGADSAAERVSFDESSQ